MSNPDQAERKSKRLLDLAAIAYDRGNDERGERLYSLGLRWKVIADTLRNGAWEATLPRTGCSYVSRAGTRIGPLRPFRDGEDGIAEDAYGRSAWFICENHGAYDRNGEYLSGRAGPHGFDIAGKWQAIDKDHEKQKSNLARRYA